MSAQLKTGTKRPSDYLAELPPPYNLNFEVRNKCILLAVCWSGTAGHCLVLWSLYMQEVCATQEPSALAKQDTALRFGTCIIKSVCFCRSTRC